VTRHAIAFSNRGKAYSEKGEFDRAIQDYDQAIRLRYRWHEFGDLHLMLPA